MTGRWARRQVEYWLVDEEVAADSDDPAAPLNFSVRDTLVQKIGTKHTNALVVDKVAGMAGLATYHLVSDPRALDEASLLAARPELGVVLDAFRVAVDRVTLLEVVVAPAGLTLLE